MKRGESDDFQRFYDRLDDDVVFELPVGEVRGKQAVIEYFVNAAATMEFRPFDKPLEYYGNGDRVVVVGDETFTFRESGATHRARWAWIYELHDALITRIVAIQHLEGVTEAVGEAVSKARVAETRSAA